MGKKWSGKFPDRSRKQSLVVLHIRINDIDGILLELIEVDCAMSGKALKKSGCPDVQWHSSGPYQISDREVQQTDKV